MQAASAAQDPAAPDAPAGAPAAPRRRRRGLLSRERILATALEILERDGESGLSMRRIAAALDTAPMSLYRHIRDKADLIEGITQLALSELASAPLTSGPWEDRVHAWMLRLRDELRAHPAIVPLLRANGETLPALLEPAEVLVGILREAGFGHVRAAQIAWELLWFAMGFVVTELRTSVKGSSPAASTFAAVDRQRDALPQLARALPDLLEYGSRAVFDSGARHLVAGVRAELEGARR